MTMSKGLLLASKEFGVELNAETTTRTFMPREENAGEIKNTETGNKSVEIMAKFKYLGTTLTHQNSIHE